jgi:hypothetical protein
MAKDWELKYTESFESRSQAYQREMEIKKKKSRVFIEKLIHIQGKCVPMTIGKVTGSIPVFSTKNSRQLLGVFYF